MTLPEKLQGLLDEFGAIDDPQERLALVVDRARHLAPLPAAERQDTHLVRGCTSRAWIVGGCTPAGLCQFRCAADSPLVHGLLGLLCEFFSGVPATEVSQSALDPLAALGLTRHLSPTRQHGLAQARSRIREIATTGGTTP